MNACGGSIERLMHPLFQAGEGGSTPTPPLSAKALLVEPIDLERARELNRRWHSRLPRFGTGAAPRKDYQCFAATCEDVIYAVAIWSNPAARALPQHTWLELRRLAIGADAPRNSASRLLRVMALLIGRGRPEIVRLISYQDTESHTGAIYRAAGWVPALVTDGGEWDTPARSRPKAQSDAPKRRWEKVIREGG